MAAARTISRGSSSRSGSPLSVPFTTSRPAPQTSQRSGGIRTPRLLRSEALRHSWPRLMAPAQCSRTGQAAVLRKPDAVARLLPLEHPPPPVQRREAPPSGQFRNRSAGALPTRRADTSCCPTCHGSLSLARNTGFPRRQRLPDRPDPARARQLVIRPAVGRTAVLYTLDIRPGPEQAQILKNDLGAIGLQVQVKTFPKSTLGCTRQRQVSDSISALRAGSATTPTCRVLTRCSTTARAPSLDDPTYQRRLADTGRLSGPQRYLAYVQARPRSRSQRCAAGRVRQPLQPRLLLRADRLPNIRGLRHRPRRALHQTHPPRRSSPRPRLTPPTAPGIPSNVESADRALAADDIRYSAGLPTGDFRSTGAERTLCPLRGRGGGRPLFIWAARGLRSGRISRAISDWSTS